MAANDLNVAPNYCVQERNDFSEEGNHDHRMDANIPSVMSSDETTNGDSSGMSLNNIASLTGGAEKRKCDSDDDSPGGKKHSPQPEEKKISLLRKNIRDVMDENQLDTTTLAAQREETERLARVAEQQKIIREYQRQTAVNRQYVRTQNRVLSLLQSENTFAKVTEVSTHDSNDNLADENFCGQSAIPKTEAISETQETLLSEKSVVSDVETKPTMEVVTIDDSSSEDDCILLSDDEEENDLEEETEDDPHNSGLHVKDTYNTPDEQGRVAVNIGHPEYDEDIFVAPQIAAAIKPHQIGGVRFLYDNIIESTKRFKTSSGFGCILAHSMGLGKTLQVVCFCDIFLRHTQSKTVLCVMPINTLQNWVSEFNMWTPRYSDNPSEVRPRQFDVFVLNDQQKTLSARAKVILKWADEGGVLLIGYELFRLLALKLISTRKRRSNKNIHTSSLDSNHNKDLMERIQQALVKPGPDLVICDEGHRIKNANAGISTALKQIRTRRRVVLTGYPLQNNLLEYWCMVDFVRPNYLGTRTEFCNMFERPIQNGQCSDSTPEDIKLMRYRAHVLHSLLVGFVQRRSHVVLQQTLPQKIEFVILTRMNSFQRRLYDTFMNDVVRSKAAPNPLKAFAVCCKIWNHPDVLYSFLKKRETDLDLEIYDAEVSGETNTAGSKNKTIDTNVTKDIADVSNINAGSSESDQQSIALNIKTDCLELNTTNGDFVNTHTREPTKPHILGQSYNKNINEYLTSNYQRDETPYTSDCNGNSYWQDPSFPYFGYSQMANKIEASSTPSFIGMLSEKNFENDANNPKESKSSELVDLDTKEINTVATNIDLDRNSISQKDSNSFKCNAAQLQGNDDKKSSIENLIEDKPSSVPGDKDTGKAKNDEVIPYEWATELMKGYGPGLIQNSPKMEIFFCILKESLKLRDRVLLFSQSLLTLNLIEKFLQTSKIPESQEYWTRGISYFRLDGSTTSQEREKLVNEFNSNPNIRLFLISTRAGSLGINLVGANRVVIFDASWNPCHDTQAVYRIYRYGQQKPCFVYRIVMDKCLEKKIYDRQIKKQGMSDRVVDECNPDAHLTLKDVTNLCHDYDNDDESKKDESFDERTDLYADLIMDAILQKHKDLLSKQPFHHESLLVDRKEKKLSQAEKRQAHKGYEMEKKASTKQNFNYSTNKFQYRIVRSDGTVFNRPVASIRPMQSARSNTVTKGIGGGARSTRWIPAEVWQRQGMTAQEMTLPLDVVIPTNSSDKSNIVLKAGQRVMVLKSTKGIYMQLDSGKIIAIRTQNKAAETEKTQKPEIIDITSESDAGADVASSDGKTPIQKAESISENDADSEPKNINKNKVEFKTPFENATSIVNNNFGKSNSSTTILKDSKNLELKSTGNMPKNSSMTYSNTQTSSSSSLFATNINPCNIEKTKHLATEYKCSSSSEKLDSPLKHIPEANIVWKKSTQDLHTDTFANHLTTTSAHKPRPYITTDNQKASIGQLEQSRHDVKINEITNVKKHPNMLPGHDVYRKTIDATPSSSTAQQSNYTPCASQKDSYGNLLYGYNPHSHLRTNSMEYTSHHSLKPTASSVTEKNQEKISQNLTKPNSSTELSSYNTQASFNNTETASSFANPPVTVPDQASTSSSAHYPSRESYNNSHPQYYGNFYDPNSISTTANYASQFGEYTPYGTYPHPHYRPTFHSNVQNTTTAALGTNPYMPWPPFVPSNTMNEPCNAVYSTSYAQNSPHQYNQWHHQR